MSVTTNSSGGRLRVGLPLWVSFVLLCVALFLAPGQSYGQATKIVGVEVAPDLKRITIRADGPLTAPQGVVLHRPNRLMLDFESSRLGSVPGKIRVEKEPIREVRLGSAGSKTRLVVDFGDQPVPQHTVTRKENAVVVGLAKAVDRTGPATTTPPKEISSKPVVKPQPGPPNKKEPVQTSDQKADNSVKVAAKGLPGDHGRTPDQQRPEAKSPTGLKLKEAGASGDIVFLELEDNDKPRRRYRVVLEVDHVRLRLVKGSMTDDRGKLNAFQLVQEKSSGRSSAEEPKVEPETKSEESAPPIPTSANRSLPNWGSAAKPSGASEHSASTRETTKVELKKPPVSSPREKAL